MKLRTTTGKDEAGSHIRGSYRHPGLPLTLGLFHTLHHCTKASRAVPLKKKEMNDVNWLGCARIITHISG